MINERETVLYKVALRHLGLPETPDAEFVEQKGIVTYVPDDGVYTHVVTFILMNRVFNQYAPDNEELSYSMAVVKIDHVDGFIPRTLYTGIDGIWFQDNDSYVKYEDLDTEFYNARP